MGWLSLFYVMNHLPGITAYPGWTDKLKSSSTQRKSARLQQKTNPPVA